MLILGRSGYTSLSIEEKRYARLRRAFDRSVASNTKDTFTVWAMSTLEASVNRQEKINDLFPNMTYVGKTKNGIAVQEKGELIEVQVSKTKIKCNKDEGICNHVLFACLHPEFNL